MIHTNIDGGDKMSKICLNCGNEVEDTAHFCNICGTEMNEQTCASNAPPEPEPAPPTEQICPSCGKTVPIDSKFCRLRRKSSALIPDMK